MGRLRDLLRRRSGPVAFVLSGGGNHGAVQVGMLRALVEHDVQPDMVLGSSIGAVNGAVYAQDPTITGVARLEELWRGLDDAEVIPTGWLPNVLALARRGEAVHSNDRLRGVLEGILRVETFEELQVPYQCVATAVLEAREVWFSSGPLVDPILASAALPGILPSVEIGGVRYLDGAIVNDVPITRAATLGATTVYVLHCGTIDRPRPEPKRPLDVVVQAYWIARRHRFKKDLESLPDSVEAIVLPTGVTPTLRYNDFTRGGELIRAAYSATERFLAGDVDDLGPLPVGDRPADSAAGGLTSRLPAVSEVNLSSSGPPETVLDTEPAEALAALADALAQDEGTRRAAIAAVAARWPRFLDAWARLGEHGRDVMEQYAAYRVGYHRGLDRLRANGWRGSGYVRWAHEENRGFLRALAGLQACAASIGEDDEAERCALFLRQLDPGWPPS